LTTKQLKFNINMTFNEFIIQERGLRFYETSLEQIRMCNSNIIDWFSELYTDWKLKEKFYNDKTSDLIGKEVVITDVIGGRNTIMSTPKIKDFPESCKVLLDNNETISFQKNNYFENFLNKQATWVHPNEVLICVKS